MAQARAWPGDTQPDDSVSDAVSDSEALHALNHYGEKIHSLLLGIHSRNHTPPCQLVRFGVNHNAASTTARYFGVHHVCNRSYDLPCLAAGYGISGHYQFELDVRRHFGCTVLALDPADKLPATLGPDVHFLRAAAPSTGTHLACRVDSWWDNSTKPPRWRGRQNCSAGLVPAREPPPSAWHVVSPAQLQLRHERERGRLAVLKMDCEGCEFSLYNATRAQDPAFWQRSVDQFAVETHLSRRWAPTDAAFLEYGRLLALLRRAKHSLVHANAGHCSGGEPTGLAELVLASGYFRRQSGHCENLLFVRGADWARRGLNRAYGVL